MTMIFVANLAFSQQKKINKPEHEIQNPIKTVVKAKANTSTNPNWTVYSDFEMNNSVGAVKVGDSVNVIGWSTWLYFIKTKDLGGYISWRALEVNKNLDSLSKVLARESPIQEDIQIKKEQELEKKKHEQFLIKEFGNADAQKILRGEFWIGMSTTMAEYSLGRPDTKNKTVTENSTHEQWVYRKQKLYLYFTNYTLKSYQY
jgi:hypothetical protein